MVVRLSNGIRLLGLALVLLSGTAPAEYLPLCAKESFRADGIVRLSKIEVYPEFRDAYVQLAREVGEASLRTEAGVLVLYALAEKADPCRVTILEIYSSQDAYRKHLDSPHFRKYKMGTAKMVKSLVLSDQTPLNTDQFVVTGIRQKATTEEVSCFSPVNQQRKENEDE